MRIEQNSVDLMVSVNWHQLHRLSLSVMELSRSMEDMDLSLVGTAGFRAARSSSSRSLGLGSPQEGACVVSVIHIVNSIGFEFHVRTHLTPGI